MPSRKTRYRLYVDESGDHTLHDLEDISRRYLSLTGVAIAMERYRTEFHPDFESLKQEHFPHSPDDPIILHRRDIVDKTGPFYVLQDADKNSAWEDGLVEFARSQIYRLFTVVIDKKNHHERYGGSAVHPYHLAMAFLLERYLGYLNWCGGEGDVMAESRNGAEDRELKDAYSRIWRGGTYYHSSSAFRGVLTSKELKIKRKTQDIAGLQYADLLAHPAKMRLLGDRGRITTSPGTFGTRVSDAFKSKYDLYGRKLFD